MKSSQLSQSWRSLVPDASSPLVLVTNDDGFDAPGLWKLVEAVAPSCRVLVCAPDRQQSWAGRAHRSDHGPGEGVDILEYRPKIAVPQLAGCFRVTGTPALCVRAAVDALGFTPDLVVSGVNDDHNTGPVATASGTLGAAWEAASSNLPAIAFSASAEMTDASSLHLPDHLHAICMRVLQEGLPEGAAIAAVNLPANLNPLTSWEVCRTSEHIRWQHEAVKDASGRWRFPYKDLGGSAANLGTDDRAVTAGRISITFWPKSIGMPSLEWSTPQGRASLGN